MSTYVFVGFLLLVSLDTMESRSVRKDLEPEMIEVIQGSTNMFREVDTNSDDILTKAEILAFYKEKYPSFTDEELNGMVNEAVEQVDRDGDDQVIIEEIVITYFTMVYGFAADSEEMQEVLNYLQEHYEETDVLNSRIFNNFFSKKGKTRFNLGKRLDDLDPVEIEGIHRLIDFFKEIDSNSDDIITEEELVEICLKKNYTDEQAKEIAMKLMEETDRDGDDAISIDELVIAGFMQEQGLTPDSEEMQQILDYVHEHYEENDVNSRIFNKFFKKKEKTRVNLGKRLDDLDPKIIMGIHMLIDFCKKADSNSDDILTEEELIEKYLKRNLTDEEAKEMAMEAVEEADSNGDDAISIDEVFIYVFNFELGYAPDSEEMQQVLDYVHEHYHESDVTSRIFNKFFSNKAEKRVILAKSLDDLDPETIEMIHSIIVYFKEADINGNDILTKEELVEFYQEKYPSLTDEERKEMATEGIEQTDRDGDDEIIIDEIFITFFMEVYGLDPDSEEMQEILDYVHEHYEENNVNNRIINKFLTTYLRKRVIPWKI